MTAIIIEGHPAFNSYRKSVKVRNFLRDPRAAAVLLENWVASPLTADIRSGRMEETPAPEAPDPDAGAVASSLRQVPDSVKQRVQRRVDAGKRIYFHLRPEN